MIIKKVPYNSKEYQQTLELRDKVMKLPLSRSIYDEDLLNERDAYILGAFDDKRLLGVGVLSQTENTNTLKVDYLCVDTDIQTKHVGTTLLHKFEEYALSIGKNVIMLEARVTAEPFYTKLNYVPSGEKFIKPNAPVEHIIMRKQLMQETKV
ncbi:hypothetical protein C7K38_00800 [Tetragenococcus osmophilus]|uniref:N-acetyltransferase domain-containing protein n=1 Tax=Tetragenococcus osmophilus TaxID=526944 RepID=A0AA37XJ23_9ENTE|nr:GNAT family N-acetyltransferase [Tetragenococcus osmophilus]AYW47036.1 hypothetical protein C7K38_00800 [Tetragenococcus osmophilus]GMA55097.1 hypothetical protein GCM10025857_64540 [Alicyclobacillus contaminans]GMA71129.1 hypothetical protein GCM10025885_01780 [Tetragenococcus osmophilus]